MFFATTEMGKDLLHSARSLDRIPALAVWRIILRWIGPQPPDRDGEEGLMLGLIVLLIIAVSLPQILTSLH